MNLIIGLLIFIAGSTSGILALLFVQGASEFREVNEAKNK